MSASLTWSFDFKKDKKIKVIEVDGETKVGNAHVRAVVKPDHIQVTFIPGILELKHADHFIHLGEVLRDLQKELNE
jgi:hypothetical protein